MRRFDESGRRSSLTLAVLIVAAAAGCEDSQPRIMMPEQPSAKPAGRVLDDSSAPEFQTDADSAGERSRDADGNR